MWHISASRLWHIAAPRPGSNTAVKRSLACLLFSPGALGLDGTAASAPARSFYKPIRHQGLLEMFRRGIHGAARALVASGTAEFRAVVPLGAAPAGRAGAAVPRSATGSSSWAVLCLLNAAGGSLCPVWTPSRSHSTARTGPSWFLIPVVVGSHPHGAAPRGGWGVRRALGA